MLPNPAEMPFPGIQYTLPNYAGGNCYTRDTAAFAFALQQSCNTPFASIALDLGQEAIADQAEKFGFGQDLGDQLKLDSAPSVFPTETLDDAGLAQSVDRPARRPGHPAADQHDDRCDRQRRGADAAEPDQGRAFPGPAGPSASRNPRPCGPPPPRRLPGRSPSG